MAGFEVITEGVIHVKRVPSHQWILLHIPTFTSEALCDQMAVWRVVSGEGKDLVTRSWGADDNLWQDRK
jgi:hypothetical protein